MPQINRANAAVNLNLPGAWNGGSGPAPTSSDIAAWGTPNITTGPSQALGGAVSWQGVLLQSAQTTNISIGTTTAALTIGSSGIDLSASGANLTIGTPVTITLGANQQWTVASGRTLTVSSVITGNAKDVTFAGAGTTVLNTAINTTWINSKLTIASGAFVQANANRILGAATNTVEVQNGGALYIASLQTSGFTVNNFTVAGSGVSGKQWGAIFIASSGDFSSGKTITLTGASPVIGLNAAAQAGVISGNATTGNVTFNMFGTNTLSATFSSTPDFTVASGSRLVLQGINPTTGATAAADFGLATTDDNGFGNGTNKISVKSSVRLSTNAQTTLYRDYFFEGQSGSGTPSSPATYSIATPENALFQGTITATAGNWVAVNNAAQTAQRTLQFGSSLGGRLDGTWNLRSFSNVQTVYLHPNLNISTWTGDLWAYRVSYGVAPTGAATYESGATIDNISGSLLTLAHSGYTLVGNLTFTGSSDMNLGAGNISASGSPTLTVSASTLTISSNITVPSTFNKNGAGTLVLSGSNTFPTSVTLSAGALVLNSANSAGGTGTQFVFSIGTELDSTSGTVLNQTGTVNAGALVGSWTWKGTSNLTFSGASVITSNDRTIVFAGTGETGTLKFSGAITTTGVSISWDFGGSTASAKQRVTLVGANASLSDTTPANQHAVTAGYFRIENNNGLGAVATTTAWWVGATNLGVVTTKAALELAGVTTPDTKNVNLYGQGPNDDGALIGASGSSTFSGSINVPSLPLGARIGVKAGATLTLLGSGAYQNINPSVSNTPLTFTAESGGTLNQNRILGANTGTVNIVNGTGTVVLSRANLHTGAMTCSAGTTKLTHANAVGAGAGNNVTVTAGATIEANGVKEVFPATLTLGNTGTPAIFKISA
jgi:autotransporter-associated beta strand protein